MFCGVYHRLVVDSSELDLIEGAKEVSELLDGNYPVDVCAYGKHVNIQVGHQGHKVWICADGQCIVRINRVSNVTVDDLRIEQTEEQDG